MSNEAHLEEIPLKKLHLNKKVLQSLQQACLCYLCEQSKTDCQMRHGFMVCPSCLEALG